MRQSQNATYRQPLYLDRLHDLFTYFATESFAFDSVCATV